MGFAAPPETPLEVLLLCSLLRLLNRFSRLS